jgi:hypothetical protein
MRPILVEKVCGKTSLSNYLISGKLNTNGKGGPQRKNICPSHVDTTTNFHGYFQLHLKILVSMNK